MRAKMALVLWLGIFFSSASFAETTLPVKNSSEFEKLKNIAADFGLGFMMGCMEEFSMEMKAKGASDDEIANALSDPAKGKAVEEKCLCKHKQVAEDMLKGVDPILEKHPQWKGKTLVMKDKKSTTKVSVASLEKVKQYLSQCR